MNKGMKTFIMVCGIVIGVGILLSVAGAVFGGIRGLSGVEERIPWISFGGSGEAASESLELESFRNIDLTCDMADVEFIESDKFAAELSYDKKLGAPGLNVTGGTLTITPGKTRRQDWFHMNVFGKDYEDTIITIYYPKNTVFDEVEVDNDMGAIDLRGLTARTLEIQSDIGSIEMERIRADKMKLDVDMGSADGTRMNVKGAEISVSTGSIDLEGRFAGKTNIDCDMGGVTLTTDLPKDSYAIEAENDMGDCQVDGKYINETYAVDNPKAKNKITVNLDAGGAEINFR